MDQDFLFLPDSAVNICPWFELQESLSVKSWVICKLSQTYLNNDDVSCLPRSERMDLGMARKMSYLPINASATILTDIDLR